jgi:phosphinothricin acetyltransferase
VRFGFKQVARFTEQGRKFGRYWDVAWFEKAVG